MNPNDRPPVALRGPEENENENLNTQDNPPARQIPTWLAERVAQHRQRKADRRAVRAEFAEARQHGLNRRQRAKLGHLRRGERR